MKKYNLSKIMKRAWELVKNAGLCISEGLKKAWKEAKNMKETMEEKLIRLGYKVWEKGDMKRIYINDFQIGVRIPRETLRYIFFIILTFPRLVGELPATFSLYSY